MFVAIIGWLIRISSISRTALADKQEAVLAKKDIEISKLEKTTEILQLQLELLEKDRDKLKSEITENKVDPNELLATLEIIRRKANAQVEEVQNEMKSLITDFELKEQELEKLQTLNSKLKEEISARKQIEHSMFTTFTHQMRNFIISTKYNFESLSSAIKNKPSNQKVDLHIDNIINEVEQIYLTLGLLYPTKLFEVQFTNVSLGKIISNILEKFQNSVSQRNIDLELKGLDKLPKVKINLSSFEIAISELINNSIIHSGEKGKIIIEAVEKPNLVELKVRNSIKEPQPQPLPITGGRGLTVIQKIIELNNGKFKFSTFEGMAELKITLPIN